MSRPGRWARSTLDYRAHLLWPEGHHPSGVLLARCGEALLTTVTQHEQPPPGAQCENCRLISLGLGAETASSQRCEQCGGPLGPPPPIPGGCRLSSTPGGRPVPRTNSREGGAPHGGVIETAV
jgi:hypothetical protein